MKRVLSLFLAIILVLSSISFNELRAESEYKYLLQAEGEEARGFNDAGALLTAVNGIDASDSKHYTLTLNDDLYLTQTIEIKGNLTIKSNNIKGNNKTISSKVRPNYSFYNFIEIKKGKLIINDVKFIGAFNYQGIYSSSNEFTLIMNNCEFTNFNLDLHAHIESGAAICMDSRDGRGEVTLNDCKIKNCNARVNRIGGAIDATGCNLTLNRCTIKKCTAFMGGAIAGGARLEIIDSTIEDCSNSPDGVLNGGPYGGYGGALAVSGNALIKGTTFKNNKATSFSDKEPEGLYGHFFGGAVYIQGGELDIEESTFEGNYSQCHGGAIFMTAGKVNIKKSTFKKNRAKLAGGAIYTGLSGSYFAAKYGTEYNKGYAVENIKDVKENLIIDDETVFQRNYSDLGFFAPPEDYKEYKNLKFKHSSLDDEQFIEGPEDKLEKINSLLNNYDIDFVRDNLTRTYDPNGGKGAKIIEKVKIDTERYGKLQEALGGGYNKIPYYRLKIKTLDETKFTNSTKFLGWNTKADGSGISYEPGKEIDHMGNLYLYAIWEKEKPRPSIEATSLTLDENYRGGKITHKEVTVGEAMDPYLYKPKRRGFTFKGWSYNKKHLDKVHYDDRIYEDTTVYAIWDEVEEEPEEIKGQEHKAYIFGYPDGTVRPNGEITRAEAAAMLARLLEIESIGSAEAPSFPDTPSAWYNKAINAVVQRGIMKGYPDGTFKPNDAITRAEFTQMIWAIDNKPYGVAPFADVIGHWAERPIGSEYQAGRIAGYPDGTFRPDNHITRCEAAVILNKIFERNFDNMSLLKCKNPQMIKYFIDLDASFWGYSDLIEATNNHEYIRRTQNRVEEDWLLIK